MYLGKVIHELNQVFLAEVFRNHDVNLSTIGKVPIHKNIEFYHVYNLTSTGHITEPVDSVCRNAFSHIHNYFAEFQSLINSKTFKIGKCLYIIVQRYMNVLFPRVEVNVLMS